MSISPEQSLISSVLRNEDIATALAWGVTKDMFHACGTEYTWIEEFYLKYEKVPSKSAFRIQFPEFSIKMVDDTAHWASEVRNNHLKISMLGMAKEVADRATNQSNDPKKTLEYMYSEIVKLTGNMGLVKDGDIFDDYMDIMQEFERRRERYAEKGYAGVPTGFHTLDAQLGGFGPGEFHIVAARMGVGKSWVLQKMAASAAMDGYCVQFAALEQTRSQVAARIFSLVEGRDGARRLFNAKKLLQGHDYNSKDFDEFLHKMKREMSGKLHVSDTSQGAVSVASIASQIERNKPDIVYIDYFGLMSMESYDWQGINRTATQLTQMANQYQIPIVVAMQLNRTGVNKDAGLEALAGADGPARDATSVAFLTKPAPNVIRYEVQKSRNTSSDMQLFCEFDPERNKFKEISAEDAAFLIETQQEEYDDE